MFMLTTRDKENFGIGMRILKNKEAVEEVRVCEHREPNRIQYRFLLLKGSNTLYTVKKFGRALYNVCG